MELQVHEELLIWLLCAAAAYFHCVPAAALPAVSVCNLLVNMHTLSAGTAAGKRSGMFSPLRSHWPK